MLLLERGDKHILKSLNNFITFSHWMAIKKNTSLRRLSLITFIGTAFMFVFIKKEHYDKKG